MELWTSPTPNGWKVTIMLEELREAGVVMPEVKIRIIDLMKGEQFGDDFTARNLNQKIPVLKDGDRSIMESGAILEYLAERYPSPLLPLDDHKWDVLPWVYWQMANLGPVFGNKLSYTRYMDDIDPIRKEHPLDRFNNEALRLVSVFDKKLGDNPYLCGDAFTIADIASYPWLRGYKWSKVDITTRPRVKDWVDRVRARPGVERGLAYGVPEGEIDKWSKERRASYRNSGSSIASNQSLKDSIQ